MIQSPCGRRPRDAAAWHRLHDIQARVANSYGEDASTIRLHAGRSASALCERVRAVAAVTGRTVHLSARFFRLPIDDQHLVLAHVAQKRAFDGDVVRATEPARRAAIEREAHEAARAAVGGRRFRCATPDHPAIAAAWGPLGHYYTAYFVMRAAGADDLIAQRRAFFCQMPDQVKEFDASCACRDYYQSADGSGLLDGPIALGTGPFGIDRATNPDDVKLKDQERVTVIRGGIVVRTTEKVEDSASKAIRLQQDRDVSEGLHCLTGLGSSSETDFRKQILFWTRGDDLDYGLALHSYGDSYAHRNLSNETFMYAPLRGHAHHIHEPDSVVRHGSLYISYAKSLYKIAQDTLPQKSRPIPVDRAMALLGPLTDMVFDTRESEEKAQIGFIRELFKQHLGGINSYAPDGEPSMYYNQFWAGHKQTLQLYGGRAGVFRRVRAVAGSWSKQRHLWDAGFLAPAGIKG